MDSYYSVGELEDFFASASEKPLRFVADSNRTLESQFDLASSAGIGIYQNEESVDFSALLTSACPNAPGPGALVTHSGLYETSPPSSGVFPPPISVGMYGNEDCLAAALVPETIGTTSATAAVVQHPPVSSGGAGMIGMPRGRVVSDPTNDGLPPYSPASAGARGPGKATPPSKASAKKKIPDKNAVEYKLKRQRNNEAVKKSRNKSKLRVLETEQRVKELEEENNQLQSKIALLSKELNVLKGLFSSAGVARPREMMERGEL